MKKILVHYPPGTPFDDFVRLAFPVIKSAIVFVPDPLQPPAPSDPWWANAIKQLEGVMDDL